MPDLGPTELIIAVVLVIIVFAVGKLPEIGERLGGSIFRGPPGGGPPTATV